MNPKNDSNDTFLVMTISGLAMMVAGAIAGVTATFSMIVALNRDRPNNTRIPRWHAFVRPFSNDAINTYRSSTKGGPLNQLLIVCWTFLGFGFLMVVVSHFLVK